MAQWVKALGYANQQRFWVCLTPGLLCQSWNSGGGCESLPPSCPVEWIFMLKDPYTPYPASAEILASVLSHPGLRGW